MTNKTERLQKVLAHAGVASRRASELLIQEGRVTVNGQVVTQMGVKVDPENDRITVDGEPLAQAEKLVYLMLHKPLEVLSTTQDDRERGRLTVLDLVEVEERVYPVGRLDLSSEGLLLLTNDGGLAEKLTHPRYHLEKEYRLLITGKPSWETLRKWRRGDIELDGQPLQPAWVEILKGEAKATWLKIVLTEGRKRQIREVAKLLGHPVQKLIRVRIGPLPLGDLKSGHWRYLTPTEVRQLKQATQSTGKRGRHAKSKSSRSGSK